MLNSDKLRINISRKRKIRSIGRELKILDRKIKKRLSKRWHKNKGPREEKITLGQMGNKEKKKT